MLYTGMLRRVAIARTNVSEGSITSITKMTRIGELGAPLVVISNLSTLLACYPDEGGDTFLRNAVLTRATRRNIPEDGILHSHRRINRKSYLYIKRATRCVCDYRTWFGLITRFICSFRNYIKSYTVITDSIIRRFLSP
jgi:hypothetical protein